MSPTMDKFQIYFAWVVSFFGVEYDESTGVYIILGIFSIVIAVLVCCICFNGNDGRIFNGRGNDRRIFSGRGEQSELPAGAFRSTGAFQGLKANVKINADETYTEEEAVEMANTARGLTILRTNEGKIYKSGMKSGEKHAEERFMEKTKDPGSITAIWIKNSPCNQCAEKLIAFFKFYSKPCIYVGRIYKENEKLKEMKEDKFTFRVWEKYCREAQNGLFEKTRKHIKENGLM